MNYKKEEIYQENILAKVLLTKSFVYEKESTRGFVPNNCFFFGQLFRKPFSLGNANLLKISVEFLNNYLISSNKRHTIHT